MGKSKTAQRAARAAGVVKQEPPKPKLHPWFKNPRYHQFEGEFVTEVAGRKHYSDVCIYCKKGSREHGNQYD